MLKIYIARHGQDEDNANGILNGQRNLPLSEIGRRQAQELASGIKASGLTFDAVYSSSLCRALETAETVTNELKLPAPVIITELIERDFGVMTGKPAKDICLLCEPDVIKTETITYFLSPEGAETFPQLLHRARTFLHHLRSIVVDGDVLLVTHGDIGKMIFAAYYDLDWQTVLTMFHFGNSELLLLSEDYKPEEAHLVRIEQFNH